MGSGHQRKPIIGVTGPGKRGRGNWLFFKWLLKWLGGEPIHIIPDKRLSMEDMDALIISGGADINPERYGRDPQSLPSKKRRRKSFLRVLFHPFLQLYKEAFGIGSSDINLERDEMEFKLLKEAEDQAKPVLGICRGMQLMNIYWGGTLYHDINSLGYEIRYKKSVFPRKHIDISNNSLLHRIIGQTKCRINSLHNQGVDQLGTGIGIIAEDENGLAQALEKKGNHFYLGVQWHPEYLPYLKNQRKIFRAFMHRSLKTPNLQHTV